MSTKTLHLDESLHRYLLSVSSREPEVLENLRQETAQLAWGRMQISPEQGQFLALLIQLMAAQKTLEIGVFTGYSSLAVALALPPHGQVVACDVSEEWTAIARRYWQQAGVAHKIDLHLAPALQTLQHLLDQGQAGSYDFAFIDADKGNYAAYYEQALQLVRPGGLIAIDNTLWSGQVADSQFDDADTIAIRAFNQKLHQDPRIALSLVPIGDGLTLALKVVEDWRSLRLLGNRWPNRCRSPTWLVPFTPPNRLLRLLAWLLGRNHRNGGCLLNQQLISLSLYVQIPEVTYCPTGQGSFQP
jgi:predicted O-methyltransferase YrrM